MVDLLAEVATVALGRGGLGHEFIPIVGIRTQDASIAHHERDAGGRHVAPVALVDGDVDVEVEGGVGEAKALHPGRA